LIKDIIRYRKRPRKQTDPCPVTKLPRLPSPSPAGVACPYPSRCDSSVALLDASPDTELSAATHSKAAPKSALRAFLLRS
jgi:hypothetical protein